MPLDGTAIAGIIGELSTAVEGGRVDKISQPEPDEIILNLRGRGTNHKLLITANASAPRLNFTSLSKTSPLQAPMFCMVLRKHISGGRIVGIKQPDFERIVEIDIDAMDEMGDRSVKTLLIEIMGKHSNIMLLDGNRKVLDAIKHIPPSVSSVRTILPGVTYSRPPSGKENPLEFAAEPSKQAFDQNDKSEISKIQQAIYQRFNGISPVLAGEICARAQVHPDSYTSELSQGDFVRLHAAFTETMKTVQDGKFSFNIYYDEKGKTIDFAALPLSIYAHYHAEPHTSPSALLESFYVKRDESYRISQKTADLRKLITTHQERCRKKSAVYDKTLKEIENRDDLRIKGELITAYLYMIEKGASSFTAQNFYAESETAPDAQIEIPLDPQLTPSENAQKYFKKYNKQKRTFAALQDQIKINQDDLAYLDSIFVAMDAVSDEADIAEIRAELAEQGFAKSKHRANAKNKKAGKAKPLRYTSSDGFDMYVGKNNTQNDELTLRFAHPMDIWLHTKEIAGSHVIIRGEGKEIPRKTIEEAAMLAAYHSKGRQSSQVPVDYVIRKNVKKPKGAKPGFVIYDAHKTIYVTPEEKEEKEESEEKPCKTT